MTQTTSFVRKIIMGLGHLEGYGPHPGVSIVVALVAIGLIAGGWFGGILSFLVYFPMLCIGAYSRSKDYERGQRNGKA